MRKMALIISGPETLATSGSNEADPYEEAQDMKTPGDWLLIISAILMLLIALPMLLWCLSLIDEAANDFAYAGAGCFAAAVLYAFSLVTAIAGTTFAGKRYRYCWCRILGYIQLTAGVLLIFLLNAYAVLTLPPLFILTVLYLSAAGWRKRREPL